MTASSCDLPIKAFSHLTDVTAMAKAWHEHLPSLQGGEFKFEACHVQYARCRTYLNPQSWHKSFMCVCYEFDTAVGDDVPHKPMLYGRAYLQGRSRKEFETLPQQSAAHLVPDLDMIVWNFPNDPQLPQLAELLDTTLVKRHLPYGRLPFSDAESIDDIRVQVVRYRPEQRCILRYDIRFGHDNRTFVLYAKVFADDNGERVFSRIEHCYGVADKLGVHIARPLGYSATLRAIWQAELIGTPLAIGWDLRGQPIPMTTIGHCLAKLHAADVPMQKIVTRETRLLDATKKSRKLAQMLPEIDTLLAEIVSHAERELPHLPTAPPAVIHGDVHFGQFLITPDGGLALFDFDEWTSGDPAQDLADLIVDPYVSHFARDQACDRGAVSSGIAATLLASYRRHAAWDVTDEAVIWHVRIQLINKAYRSAIQQESDWRVKVVSLITLAVHGIDLGGKVKMEWDQ